MLSTEVPKNRTSPQGARKPCASSGPVVGALARPDRLFRNILYPEVEVCGLCLGAAMEAVVNQCVDSR